MAPEIEAEVVRTAEEYPAYGQLRAANELRKGGVLISRCGVISIWLRHDLETFKKRLIRLEEKAAKEGIVYTEAQLVALEQALEKETDPEAIETLHPGYLIAQDILMSGYLKEVWRIYQQTVIDTYSSVAFAKVYNTKIPVTAADTLNDRVLPLIEEHDIEVLRVLTDRGTRYCGRDDRHACPDFFRAINDPAAKTKHPQTNVFATL